MRRGIRVICGRGIFLVIIQRGGIRIQDDLGSNEAGDAFGGKADRAQGLQTAIWRRVQIMLAGAGGYFLPNADGKEGEFAQGNAVRADGEGRSVRKEKIIS
jgi:hypothetical protein